METHETLRMDPLFLELIWQEGELRRIGLRWSSPGDESRLAMHRSGPLLMWLRGYLSGTPRGCPDLPLHWKGLSGFSRQVLFVLQAQVSAGQWISYSDLAARCGYPGAARAVGRAMAANPWPLLVPCHRVLGARGHLTGFGAGLDIKRFLLKMEGIRFSTSGAAKPVENHGTYPKD